MSDTLLPATLAGLGSLFVSILAGTALSGVRDTVGLENVAIVYMTIVAIAAIAGGTSGGLIAAVGASLSYNFFFTTPYRTLRIDTFEQVVTVALLFVAGALISLATNATRGRLSGDEEPAPRSRSDDVAELVEAVEHARVDGTDAGRVAVQGLQRLHHAHWVALIPFDDARDRAVVWAGDPPVVDELDATGSTLWERLRQRLDRSRGIGVTAHVFVDGRDPAVLVIMPRAGRRLAASDVEPTVRAVVRALEADTVGSSRDSSKRA